MLRCKLSIANVRSLSQVQNSGSSQVYSVKRKRGDWVLIAPVQKLDLTAFVNLEFTVDRVTFIEASALARRRKKFGLPNRLSELEAIPHGAFKNFFAASKTFAILRQKGVYEDCEQKFLDLVHEELAILAMSQIGYLRRRISGCPTILMRHSPGALTHLAIDAATGAWTRPGVAVGPLGRLVLDEQWVKFAKRGFFEQLLHIITKKVKVQRKWRLTLRNAAILVGQSRCALDPVQGFLWNMIALEMLLSERSGGLKKLLPERAEALLGASTAWRSERYATRIGELYKKRNLLVHEGQRNKITDDDLVFSDELLFQLFTNIVKHADMFPSKQALIQFSEDVKAAKRLGGRRRVRPKGMGIHWPPGSISSLKRN